MREQGYKECSEGDASRPKAGIKSVDEKDAKERKDTWRTLSPYERIEQVIALVLTYLIAVIILIATWGLAKEVFLLAWHGLLDPLDHRMFQAIFGQIMT